MPDLLRKTRLGEEITGYDPVWGEDWVSARPPTSAEAREFGVKRGSPVVVVHSRRFGADDTVLEYSELTARADTRVGTGTPTGHRLPGLSSWAGLRAREASAISQSTETTTSKQGLNYRITG